MRDELCECKQIIDTQRPRKGDRFWRIFMCLRGEHVRRSSALDHPCITQGSPHHTRLLPRFSLLFLLCLLKQCSGGNFVPNSAWKSSLPPSFPSDAFPCPLLPWCSGGFRRRLFVQTEAPAEWANEQLKKPWLFTVYMDYTTHLYRDYNKPLKWSLLTNQYR